MVTEAATLAQVRADGLELHRRSRASLSRWPASRPDVVRQPSRRARLEQELRAHEPVHEPRSSPVRGPRNTRATTVRALGRRRCRSRHDARLPRERRSRARGPRTPGPAPCRARSTPTRPTRRSSGAGRCLPRGHRLRFLDLLAEIAEAREGRRRSDSPSATRARPASRQPTSSPATKANHSSWPGALEDLARELVVLPADRVPVPSRIRDLEEERLPAPLRARAHLVHDVRGLPCSWSSSRAAKYTRRPSRVRASRGERPHRRSRCAGWNRAPLEDLDRLPERRRGLRPSGPRP